jgi:ABC-2 type transport system ATP-binding protein
MRIQEAEMNETVLISNLRKAYGNLVAVDGISVSVARGEIFGLLGPNGAGKSTTIECALGVRTRDSGEVSLLGLDPHRDRRELFQRVGIQFQESGYQDKIKVSELCDMTQALYDRPAEWRELLARLGLGSKEKASVGELSGGQRQRLAIVLALIPDPELVFLDELTTGLDPKARREVWAFIKELKGRGVTVFLSSHYMDEVECLCDRIAILKAGRIAVQGTPSELIELNKTKNLEEAFLLYMDRSEEALKEEA